jgi:hypothetical protein
VTISAAVIVIVKAYLITGIAVAVPFLVVGIGKLDPSARGAYAFRALVLPGVILLWPVVVLRWSGAWIPHPDGDLAAQRSAHYRIWIALAVALVATLMLAWSLRQISLPDASSQRLAFAGMPVGDVLCAGQEAIDFKQHMCHANRTGNSRLAPSPSYDGKEAS